MYKILLADDEKIVLDSLRFIIEKEFGEECQIDSVKTGRLAIEHAERIHPDIVIMDIQMPGINGIETIRQIKELDPNILFIIVSAYDKFGYAKEAINLGVFEYMNKPIRRTDLIRVLRDAMNRISGERQKRSREIGIREKMENVVPIIENGMIYDILFNENYSENMENFKELLDIEENYGFIAVLLCGEDIHGTRMTNAVGSSVRLQRDYSRIRGNLKLSLNCMIGSAMGNKIVLFLPYDKMPMEYQDRIEVIERSREMIRFMRTEYNTMFRMGFGPVRSLEEMHSSYIQAIKALSATKGSVVHADDVPIRVDYEDNYPIDDEKQLFASVEKKETDSALHWANSFFDWMENGYPDALDDIRLKVIELVLRIETMVYQQVGGSYRFQSRGSYLSEILAIQTLPEIRSWFLKKIVENCEKAQSGQSERADNAIGRAVKYIEENYNKNEISLDDVSREVDISPYYFSKLFKEETGCNFIDYLTDIRIRRAKELLLYKNLSMKEICVEIGYADPNYFSRTFKKNVGVTPTEFKEKGGIL